jgi:hypothetical protein
VVIVFVGDVEPDVPDVPEAVDVTGAEAMIGLMLFSVPVLSSAADVVETWRCRTWPA